MDSTDTVHQVIRLRCPVCGWEGVEVLADWGLRTSLVTEVTDYQRHYIKTHLPIPIKILRQIEGSGGAS